MALKLLGSVASKLNVISVGKFAVPVRFQHFVSGKDPIQEYKEHPRTECLIYYDFHEGKRKTIEPARHRFFRLHWGGWIRARAGRHKHLWKKPGEYRWWARQHVFCDSDQALMLEKMITPDVKKVRHFVDDPYAPYHKRHNFDVLPRGKDKLSTSYVKLTYEY